MEEKNLNEAINTTGNEHPSKDHMDSTQQESTIPNFVLQEIQADTNKDQSHVDIQKEVETDTIGKQEKMQSDTQEAGIDSIMQSQAQSQKKPQDTAFIQTPKKNNKHVPLLLAGCLLLGGIGGFGGAYAASFMQGGTGNTVLYQSVEKTDSEGNSVTTMSVKDVVTNTSNSVVEITTESAATDSFMQQMITTGAGSGVIISKDGYIVTNNHVVEGATKVTVRTKDGTEYQAKIIGTDSKTDLAVIKIEATDLSAAILGTSADLSVGDEAIAIGNPLGELGGTVTQGIISALDREISIDGQTMTLLQTDTAINKGNSGGGLFNNKGELIGIVNAKSSGSSVEGLAFAIPIDSAKPVITSLIENGYVTGRPQLGVSMVNITDETSAFQAGVNELGVYIAKVNKDSAAEAAGLQVRDRILKVEGEEITSSSQISKIVSGKKVGDSITMVIERDGKEQTISATLKEEVVETNTDSSNSQNENPYSKYFQ